MLNSKEKISIIIPVFNEEQSIAQTVSEIKKIDLLDEIIIVNDGSTDNSLDKINEIEGVKVISHERNIGYGASLKTGAKNALGEILVIIDCDGSYPVESVTTLLEFISDYDMVVGARVGKKVKIPLIRKPAKYCLNLLANILTNSRIPDLNSGLRVFRRSAFAEREYLLPDGFSLTTTITIAYLSDNRRVKYVPIDYHKREGSSKIKPIRDTLDFFTLIVSLVFYFNPLKVTMPLSILLFSVGLLHFAYNAIKNNNVTEMSVLILLSGGMLFIIGLLADMIVKINKKTHKIYSEKNIEKGS